MKAPRRRKQTMENKNSHSNPIEERFPNLCMHLKGQKESAAALEPETQDCAKSFHLIPGMMPLAWPGRIYLLPNSLFAELERLPR